MICGLKRRNSQSNSVGRYLLWTYFKFYASFLQVTIYYGSCGEIISDLPHAR